MPFALLREGLRRRSAPPRILPASKPLARRYDVIIVGGGGHGLAAAYHLAKDYGTRNVAVMEKGYLAGGNTARNTAIVRSNYLTPEGVAFYAESVALFRNLSDELDFNIMYSERGHFTLAHTDTARHDIGGSLAFSVLSESASAEYFWDCLVDAMTEFGGAVCGAEALSEQR
jgi:sarcosine oxidase, subunit beta